MPDKELLTEIYNLCSKELYVYIYRFIGSRDTSEDLLQDTFHNLIKYAENHDIDKMKARAFLYKTAHNLCVNFRKRQARISFPSLNEYEIQKDENPAEKIEAEEIESRIYELLKDADPVSKSVYIMKKEMNMDTSEIAKNTGKSERTVRRKLQAVIGNIYDTLTKEGLINE